MSNTACFEDFANTAIGKHCQKDTHLKNEKDSIIDKAAAYI